MAIKGRDELNSGIANNGSFAADDANNLPENTSVLGFLKNLKVSSIVDNTLNRSIWLRTMFFQRDKAFVHKIEDKATATQVGGTIDPDLAINSYVSYEQLPDFQVVNNTISGSTFPFLQITPTGSGRKNKLFNFKLTTAAEAFLTPKPPTTIRELYINTANKTVNGSQITDNGDGSVLNPFGTIDGNTDTSGILTNVGGLLNYLSSATLYGQNYTIRFSGGLYTTQGNLSTGNAIYCSPGTIINYTGTAYLFDSVDTYNINVYGYGDFLSSTGGIIRSTCNDAISNINFGNLTMEFNSIKHSTTQTAIKLSGYYSTPRKVKIIKFNTISSNGTAFDLGSITEGANAEISGVRLVAPTAIKITNLQNNVNFNNIIFTSTTNVCRFETTSGGSIVNFKNCEFYINSDNVKIFDFSVGFQPTGTGTFIYFLNSKVKYGSSATTGIIIFNATTAPTNNIRLQCVNFIYPTSTSAVTLYSNTANFTQIYPAGVITYFYNVGE